MNSPRRPGVPAIDRNAERAATADDRRRQIESDLARTVQEATARRLAEAIAEYDAALDRGVLLHELRLLDREVARAERAHIDAAAAQSSAR